MLSPGRPDGKGPGELSASVTPETDVKMVAKCALRLDNITRHDVADHLNICGREQQTLRVVRSNFPGPIATVAI
jgi:hypothetical protein